MVIPGPTLIIVDDEPAIRAALFQVFTQLGYGVRTAEDGFSALALIRECSPQVLLSDLNMPGMSGFELLSVARRTHPTIFVVATSGAFAGKSVPAGIAADAFYEKATNLSFLVESVKAGQPSDRKHFKASNNITPMWISPAGRLASQEIYLLIGCPCCLRAFPKVVAEADELICKTGCPYCRTVITYAVVPSAELHGGLNAGRSSTSSGKPHTSSGSEGPNAFSAGL